MTIQGTPVEGISTSEFLCSFCLHSYHLQHLVSCTRCRCCGCINCVNDNRCCEVAVDVRKALYDKRLLDKLQSAIDQGVGITVQFGHENNDVRLLLLSIIGEFDEVMRRYKKTYGETKSVIRIKH